MSQAGALGGVIRVLIVADIALHGEGLQTALGESELFMICRSAAVEPVGPAWASVPDVVVLDVQAAVSSARAIRQLAPETPIVAIQPERTDDEVILLAAAGVNACVAPELSAEDFALTVAHVSRGERPCCNRIASALLSKAGSLVVEATSRVRSGLTPRENEVVKLVVLALSNKEIAACLQIELTTVKRHVHNILDKLQVARRGEIVAWARAQSDRHRPVYTHGVHRAPHSR